MEKTAPDKFCLIERGRAIISDLPAIDFRHLPGLREFDWGYRDSNLRQYYLISRSVWLLQREQVMQVNRAFWQEREAIAKGFAMPLWLGEQYRDLARGWWAQHWKKVVGNFLSYQMQIAIDIELEKFQWQPTGGQL